MFYTRLVQHAISVANFWNDPHHRDLYLKYSLYLPIIDNAKHHKHLMTTTETNNETTKSMELRISTAIATVATAIDRVAEGHINDDKSDADCVTTGTDVDTIMANISVDDADIHYWENTSNNDNNSNANMRKLGLSRLQHLVLIGGPDDGVISPWQSRCFIFNCNNKKSYNNYSKQYITTCKACKQLYIATYMWLSDVHIHL